MAAGSLPVLPFSTDSFFGSCELPSYRTRADYAEKKQVRYLYEYLRAIGCACLVIEDDYIDRDYLNDYAAYYAKCFRTYQKKCRRLHFFSVAPSALALETYLQATSDGSILQTAYLGFTVLRPLPDAFIGRTCLATYPPDGGRRRYVATRTYEVHVAGLDLRVNSLAFQEQDTVLAACATTAIWSALHKVATLFDYSIPSPGEITARATQHGVQMGRTLPSRGLELGQMCRAILSCGLEVELREGNKLEELRGLVYGYGELGLPTILGLEGPAGSSAPEDAHAVTIVGYSLPPSATSTASSERLSLRSDAINEYYVHDDQIGPFVAAEIAGKSQLRLPGDIGDRNQVPWNTYSIFAALIPVYPKIRVRYEDAWDRSAELGALIAPLQQDPTDWDIRLSTGVLLKSDYARAAIRPALRRFVLVHQWPRFVWRSTLSTRQQMILELVIDATDIERAFTPYSLLVHDEALRSVIRSLLEDSNRTAALRKSLKASDSWLSLLQKAIDE